MRKKYGVANVDRNEFELFVRFLTRRNYDTPDPACSYDTPDPAWRIRVIRARFKRLALCQDFNLHEI